MRYAVLVSVCCVGLSFPVAAQRARQVELGVLGNYTRFDRRFLLENQFGAGGRVGFFLTNHLSLEVDAAYLEPGGNGLERTLAQGGASLVLNVGNDRNLFYILGGYSRLAFLRSGANDFSDNALHGAIGDRIFLSPGLALRGEVRGLYTPSTRFDTTDSWVGHVMASLGLSFFVGGKPATDTDHDGLADRLDACPGTASGATIDTRGCPTDSDHDGTFNGLDACPNTPPGAQTDRSGCPLDGDKDGVPDGIDQCSGSSAGAAVDARGCTADADGDRVADGVDQCPNSEFGTPVDTVGCPIDADKDGVPDGLDRCPNTAPGTEVDTSGCTRLRDADADGVNDDADRCPGTAGGARVDSSGCPILFTPERTAVVLRGVNFESGSSTLRPESFAVLDQVAASLVANPDIRIEIRGHTDNTGGQSTNLRLSQERANTVMRYLAGKGVNRFHMAARGFGAAQPVAPNTTAAGRAQNRRVELRRIF
jgi:outer membrane protein OmpA-like peptidoglycan-associated protein